MDTNWTPIEGVCLYYRAPGSDKVYNVTMFQVPGGYVVQGENGPRGGTLVVRPQNKLDASGKPIPVDMATARKLFDDLVKDKKNHRKTPYIEDPDGQNPNYIPPENTNPTDYLCQLFTSIEDGDAAAKIVENTEYAAQPKYDGKRIVLMGDKGGITAYNRTAKACPVPQTIVDSAKIMVNKLNSFVFDGEQVGDAYYAFDLLSLDACDLRGDPFKARIQTLQNWFRLDRGAIHCAPTAFEVEQKRQLIEELYLSGAEGVMLKRLTSKYRSNRQKDQFKHKFTQSASCFVVALNDKASVRLGLFNDGDELVEVGNCTIRSPLKVKVGDIVEVRYLYAYRGGSLYQPIMLSIRDDLSAPDCTLSQLRYKAESRS